MNCRCYVDFKSIQSITKNTPYASIDIKLSSPMFISFIFDNPLANTVLTFINEFEPIETFSMDWRLEMSKDVKSTKLLLPIRNSFKLVQLEIEKAFEKSAELDCRNELSPMITLSKLGNPSSMNALGLVDRDCPNLKVSNLGTSIHYQIHHQSDPTINSLYSHFLSRYSAYVKVMQIG